MKCELCEKETKELFDCWLTSEIDDENWESECSVCEDCIKTKKQYDIKLCYSEKSDITFIFAIAKITLDETHYIELSQTLISYAYGLIDKDDNYVQWALKIWLNGTEKERKDLLRQAFVENDYEEVLY